MGAVVGTLWAVVNYSNYCVQVYYNDKTTNAEQNAFAIKSKSYKMTRVDGNTTVI